jgi:hypothetical protein
VKKTNLQRLLAQHNQDYSILTKKFERTLTSSRGQLQNAYQVFHECNLTLRQLGRKQEEDVVQIDGLTMRVADAISKTENQRNSMLRNLEEIKNKFGDVFAHSDLDYFAAALNDLYKYYSPEKVRDIILSNCDSMIEQGEKLSILEHEFEDDPIKRKEDDEFIKSGLGRLGKKDTFPREDDTSEEDFDEKSPPPPRVKQDSNQ